MTDRKRDDYDPDGYDGDDGVDEAKSEADAREAAERDVLLEERRARQMGGGKGKNGRVLMGGMLLGVAGLAFVIAVGPTEALRILGLAEREDGQKTSQVDLEVEKQSKDKFSMDFLMPDGPVAEPAVDPNAEWNRRFQELQKQLEDVAKANKQPDVSLRDMQDLLRKYNDQMADKLEEERKKMSAENVRLRAETERLQEEKKRAEELALQEEMRRKKNQDVDDLQRESKGVLIDESGSTEVAVGAVASHPDDQNSNERFLASAAGSVFETSLSKPLADPSRTVVQGTIVSAVLETAINTELPGNIRAQVTEPVFSFDGRRILMPAGTVLIGTFNNDVEIAQKRVLIAWNRAVTPEGKSIALGSTGTDVLGRAGTGGNVDNRLKTKIGAAVLVSSISAIPTAIAAIGGNRSNSGTTINIGTSGASASAGGGASVGQQVASDIAGQVSQQGQSILGKYLSLPPVIRVPQGQEIRVFVNRDLIFR
ncbi:type IV secretion system protein VirB10 [Rhizobium aethiopicum]|uniref:TrbI/VirB10 family protein n=1 Tax=Rhizobium aethiopicum TaxID=1138170 RepID=UPI0016140ED7|nr:TrbI/VirB10 family protein [Rhizobium aethiopicum]MBB4581578.1 type IV secretion system protein VirB10 [Rhizobium aethiopicum]